MRLYTLIERTNIVLSMNNNELRVKLINGWLEKKEITFDGYNYLAKKVQLMIQGELK